MSNPNVKTEKEIHWTTFQTAHWPNQLKLVISPVDLIDALIAAVVLDIAGRHLGTAQSAASAIASEVLAQTETRLLVPNGLVASGSPAAAS